MEQQPGSTNNIDREPENAHVNGAGQGAGGQEGAQHSAVPQKAISDKQVRKGKVRKKKPGKHRWAIQIFFLTFVLSLSFSLLAELLSDSNAYLALGLLVILIFINIVFDVVAVAAASCAIEPFLSMATKKIKGAKMAVRLLKNAEKVNNVCSDVIGDICGIVSGALGAAIVAKLFIATGTGADNIIISILFSSVIAALTVGGKAVGKHIAMHNAHDIVFFVARVLTVFSKK